MNNIEVEIRSFIDKNKYDELLNYFNNNAKNILEDYQETFYFDCPQDLRIQKNNFYAKVWLKKGKLHDEYREEVEIKVEKEDFDKLEQLYLALGYKVKIKWFRNRNEYKWEGVKVSIDYTKGYGYILELEILCSDNKKDESLSVLKEKIKKLGIVLSPREYFEQKYKYYESNWKTLIKQPEKTY